MQNGRKVFFLFLPSPQRLFLLFPYHRFTTRCRGKRRQALAEACGNVPRWCGAKPYHFEVYDWGQLFLRFFSFRITPIENSPSTCRAFFWLFLRLSIYLPFTLLLLVLRVGGNMRHKRVWRKQPKKIQHENMPHGLTAIAVYVNLQNKKISESEIIHESNVEICDKVKNILRSNFEALFVSVSNWFMPLFDRLMYIKGERERVEKRKKTFTFIFVRRKKAVFLKWRGGSGGVRHSFQLF